MAGAQVLVEEGVRTLELSLTSPGALDAIRSTPGLVGDRALVGAGTIRCVLPGAMTPTEVSTALAAGAQLVKLFLAVTLGPEFLRQVQVPLPERAAVPTGGIELEHAREWVEAGAVALGVGSPLSGQALDDGDTDQLRERARGWKAVVS